MQQWRTDAPAATFDMVSMERSKGFVKALQELKNLRPQLYSAAEYCERSYLHNEQKQIVLDNLKDYAVRALVNAVDHLGTVAYKLTDLFEQQTSDMSTVELKISSLNQRVLTSQCFIDKDNLRQRQLFPICPRHHKHYILPNSVSKGAAHSNPPLLTEKKQSPVQTMPRPHPLGTQGTKTLLWHLASEPNATSSEGASKTPSGNEDTKDSKVADLLHPTTASGAAHLQSSSGTPTPDPIVQALLAKDAAEVPMNLSSFQYLDNNAGRREIIRPPLRSKSMLSAFFVKNKYPKQKKALVL
ncbi:unnamed protein product [Spirodela intermedia]|uniref:Uncharacterized protein n=1 Tax=Spirodela intermedia TaxID=51605 RepID=A0A7I8KHT1_SPIIN|nr:unnamed protein product [Spirodela intermedia]